MIRSSDDDDDDAENISALLLQCSLLLLLPVGGVCMRFFCVYGATMNYCAG